MLPYLDFQFFGHAVHLHTNTALMIIYLLGGMGAFSLAFRKDHQALRALALVIIVALSAFFGARLFHLIFEQPWSEFDIFDLFEDFDGMTFYGSLIAGLMAMISGGAILFRRDQWTKISDLAAIIAAFGYGILRIGCFANGCCWGSITKMPWAVRYYDSTVMPALGIPVHPVQIYDSILGFALGFFLLKIRDRQRGYLMLIFVGLYAIGRSFTEIFRGDIYRGENILFGLSTSQVISVFMGLSAFFIYWVLTLKRRAFEYA